MYPRGWQGIPIHLGPALDEAELVVYAVHGRGQSPDFMAEIASRISLPEIAWILPAAPDQSWYPEGFMAPLVLNQPTLDRSLAMVRTDVDSLLSGCRAPVVAFGFSQGACLLSEYILRDRPGLAGAVLHTGGYLGPRQRRWKAAPNLNGLEVQMFTAAGDEWVPLDRVEETRDALEDLAATVGLTVYDDEKHHVNDDSEDRIREHLTAWAHRQPAGRPPVELKE